MVRGALVWAAERVRGARTALLTVAGLVLLSAAAWVSLGRGAGLAAAGVSCLVVEVLVDDDKEQSR